MNTTQFIVPTPIFKAGHCRSRAFENPGRPALDHGGQATILPRRAPEHSFTPVSWRKRILFELVDTDGAAKRTGRGHEPQPLRSSSRLAFDENRPCPLRTLALAHD